MITNNVTARSVSRKNIDPEFPIEAARLNLTWIWGIAFSLFTSAYGWCVQFHVHIAAPLTMAFFSKELDIFTCLLREN